MIIIIASTRVPKVNGVKRAVERLSSQFGMDVSKIQFNVIDVKSEVSDMPKSIFELSTIFALTPYFNTMMYRDTHDK